MSLGQPRRRAWIKTRTQRQTPITAAGSANQELFQNYVVKWQAGKGGDLQGGLQKVDKQIDAQIASSAGTQVP